MLNAPSIADLSERCSAWASGLARRASVCLRGL